MKTLLVFLLSTAVVFAEENPVVLNPGYQGGEYVFSGTVETEMGAFKSVRTFTGKTTSDTFSCSWINDMGAFQNRGEVKVDKQGGTFVMDGIKEQQFADPAMAIASATGVSGGSARLMYDLWTGNPSAVLPTQNVQITQMEDKTEVSGNNGSKARFSVVTLRDGTVVSVRSEFDPRLEKSSPLKAEMSEQQIKVALKAMGKPDTREEVENFKSTLKQAESSLAALKDKINTVTTVVVNGLPQ